MRALISVSDKTGLVDFSQRLSGLGVEIVSTSGTAKALKDAGLPVKLVEEITAFPEILGGRVKTLHPRIFGGILAQKASLDQEPDLEALGVCVFDLVVVNLYPFETVTARAHALSEAVENIDIGGVSLIRAAAKNFERVAVITRPSQYAVVFEELAGSGNLSLQTCKRLAAQAFSLVARYDAVIDQYLSAALIDKKVLHLSFSEGKKLRYGENWHQQGTFFKDSTSSGIASAIQHHGKEISYNNLLDGNAALEAVRELREKPAVCVVKHTNPCGLATGPTLKDALLAAWSGDVVSAYGSVIACSRPIDLETAHVFKGKFVEMILVPGFSAEALTYLKEKSVDLRLLEVPPLAPLPPRKEYRSVAGGMLEQDRDSEIYKEWKCVTVKQFPDNLQALAVFTSIAAKHVKSNAVVLGVEYQPGYYKILGIGAGQPNRVDSLRKLAIPKAEENIRLLFEQQSAVDDAAAFKESVLSRAVLVSDAFFPFDDTVREAAEHGISFIVQPGGSIRDKDVIDACNELGVAMIFTGMRHFRH